ncbi:M14 family metallopeptidase [Varunaivibrio sulfuroxidans]|uniref:Murein tripeptide amidase MpaA n=1 Tax=Varunaivibrio sulfuroxidans TaxID=1773489 RepID=A0A4R3J7N4_9PROT|nr:M14-type cytosolic carboxypeptidase [Varunaivibrio sulfuroxidans]TCS60906.1 murein tripeptide amidase MpaA [Varunaivibrio sulfuroxidans]WES31686.1 M14-type cytosolic carboxypeptidase [Varunaivibrio sulfuroxidans]
MHISSAFDGGNIHCLHCTDPSDIQLEINRDNGSDFYQWFYFRLSGAQNTTCVMKIANAGGAAYPKGWENYQAAASYDREHWFRVPTRFDGETLTLRHTPTFDSVYYAYFAPYPMSRHGDLIADAQMSPLTQDYVLGETLDGQDIDLLKIGTAGPGKKVCWVIARQHPGETMAEWWMEGFLSRLLDADDAIARAVVDRAVFYVVPNMNPDGARRGHLRTNACGANLNREWQDPTAERSPEVLLVRQKMQETGVDFCLDVHGDETLPYNFIAGPEGTPAWDDRRDLLLQGYKDALRRVNPDFQTRIGYERDAPGKANMTLCTNWVAETFRCLAMTLEMPFKDSAITPNPEEGWSPERSRKLGASCLDALYAVINRLHDEGA